MITINKDLNFETVSQDKSGSVLDTTSTSVPGINSSKVESVNLDDMFADVHNTIDKYHRFM